MVNRVVTDFQENSSAESDYSGGRRCSAAERNLASIAGGSLLQ